MIFVIFILFPFHIEISKLSHVYGYLQGGLQIFVMKNIRDNYRIYNLIIIIMIGILTNISNVRSEPLDHVFTISTTHLYCYHKVTHKYVISLSKFDKSMQFQHGHDVNEPHDNFNITRELKIASCSFNGMEAIIHFDNKSFVLFKNPLHKKTT